MEELKRCLYALDYLGFMQVVEEEQRLMQGSKRFMPKNHVTTQKSMVMQEKEFLYNFWCVLNPLNQPEVDNALLYDVLLLLIYNVQQPLHVTINYLVQYLETHYKELGIDLDSFENYNSGSSLGTGGSPDHPKGNELSNLSKYLSYCNLWPIERLAFEFRQIHVNGLGNQFSSVNSKKRERCSLSPFERDQNAQNIVNPNDGRKYKKTVIEEHLQDLTFSPRLSTKSKELDQRLTQKLIGINKNYMRRDVSADIVSQRAASKFAINLEPIDNFSIDENGASPSNFKRYELLLFRQ